MPAIITHDFFGRDVYDRLFQTIGGSRDEAQAFLLGNQGPDPLFYTIISPWLKEHGALGNTMHHSQPSALLKSFHDAVNALPEADKSTGRAYTLGFLCHYTLDAAMHPLVYSQQYAICDAGVSDLTRAQGSEVHAVIESEWDEMVLFTKRNETIAQFNTSTEILKASDHVLNVISGMYAQVTSQVYGEVIPSSMFATAVRDFRIVQSAFYSRTGLKRDIVGRIERVVRPYSFYQSMSHRAIETTTCSFDNHNNETWVNPFTNETSKKSFWDIFYGALNAAERNIAAFDVDDFSWEDARQITGGLNFSGDPVEADAANVADVADVAGVAGVANAAGAKATAAAGVANAAGSPAAESTAE